MKLIQSGEAAELTGLSRQTIQNWMQKGTIKVHKVGKAWYVDADTITALGDTLEDVKATHEAMLKEKEAYEKQRFEYQEMRNDIRDKVWRVRYLNVMTNSAIRTDFYKSMVDLLEMNCHFVGKEGNVLCMLLEGLSSSEVAKCLGISNARVQQIVTKAIRKSKDLTVIKKKFEDLELKDAYIEDLKMRLDSLKQQLVEVENTKLMREKMEAEEYVAKKMREDEYLNILQQRIVDLCRDRKVSIRAAHSCNQLQIETIADLASCYRSDIHKARNCGKKTLCELDDLLESYGLKFGTDTKYILEKKKQEFIDEWKMLNS